MRILLGGVLFVALLVVALSASAWSGTYADHYYPATTTAQQACLAASVGKQLEPGIDVCTGGSEQDNVAGSVTSYCPGQLSNWYWYSFNNAPYGYMRDLYEGCVTPTCPSGQTWNGAMCVQQAAQKSLGAQCPATGDPCNASTGNEYQIEADYSSGDSHFVYTRFYNSQANRAAGLGFNWSASPSKRLEISSSAVQVRRADGRGEPFTCPSSGSCQGDSDTQLSLSKDASGYSLTRRDNASERYDVNGRLTTETDAAGRTTSYAYDANGRLFTVTDAFGHSLTFGYDANNHVASVTDAASNPIGYLYDANNNLTRVNYPDGTAKLYHYEDANNPHGLTGISYVDTAGTVTRFATINYYYNPNNTSDPNNGKAILTEHAQTDNGLPQEQFTLSYNSDTQTTVTDPAGTQDVMTFATNLGVKNLVAKTSSIDTKTLQQAFDANNNLTCRKDEEGRVTTYTYNGTNQKLSMTEGLAGDCSNPTNNAGTARTTTYEYLVTTSGQITDLPTFICQASVYSGAAACDPNASIASLRNTTHNTEIVYGDAAHPNLPTSITQRGFTRAGTSISRTVTLGYTNGTYSTGQLSSIDGPRTDVNDLTTLAYNDCTTGYGCGQLSSVTNALGQVTTYDSYDANGRLLQMTDPNGLKTAYTYDARGRVKTITRIPLSGTSAQWKYSYTVWGDVSQVIDPDGVVLNYGYDAAHYLRTITDAAGNQIRYKYDLKGNRTEDDSYDYTGTLKRTTSYVYDLRNHLSQIDNAGNATQLVYDAVGNLIQETDPNNNPPTQHTPDALNRLIQTIDRLGGTTTYGYDVNDRPAFITPPGKDATQYSYDDLGNLLQEVSPDRGTTNYTYDAAGNLKTAQTARGLTLTYTYDALNRPILAAPRASIYRTTYVYDSCTNGIGRLCSVSNGNAVVNYSYDGLGNVTQHQSLTYGYTAAGRLSTVTYPSGALVTYLYNFAGQVKRVNLTRNGTTQAIASGIQHMPFGPIKALTYGNGKTLTQVWDTAYRLSSQAVPGVLQFDYSQYDANGNLRQRSEAVTGSSSSFTYDPLDRLDTADNPGFLNYDYDANGNRTLFQQGFNSTSYIYAPNSNRLAQVAGSNVTLDADGNLTAQGTRTYVYTSAFDYLTQALENGSQIAGYAYNGLGQRVSKQTNGTTTSYFYGLDGSLLVETSTNGAPREYVYLDGQPLAVMDQAVYANVPTAVAVTTVPALKGSSISINWSGIASPTTTDWVGIYVPGSNDYSYMDWTYTSGAASGTVSLTLSSPSLVTGATYEARLYANDGYTLLAKSAPFVLNPTGPVVAVTSAPAILHEIQSVGWSGITNPTSADWVGVYVPGSADTAYLDWAYTNGGSSGTVGVTLNDPNLVAGNTYEMRLYANDGYTLLAKSAPFTVVAATQTSPAALYYVHNDQLGTPQAMTDNAGNVVWRAVYDPFGQATVTVNTITNNLRFPGMYADAETGLYYNMARYYDPKIGRYISSDPIGLAGGMNTYSYVGGNPLRYVDPLGLLTVNIWKYRGSTDAWGHVSIRLDNGRYISWWPGADRQGLLKSFDIYSAPAIPNQTYLRDVFLEGQAPDYQIRIEGLDEAAIEKWWDEFRVSNEWKTLSQNCSTTGSDALKAGDAAKYASWWSLHNMIWTPNDVKALTESINRGLKKVYNPQME